MSDNGAAVIAARRAQQAERAAIRKAAKARITAANPQHYSMRYAS